MSGARRLGCLLASALAWACTAPPAGPPPSVLVAPANFNQSLPAPLEPGIPIVQEEVRAYLEVRGARIVAPPLAEFHDTWLVSAGPVRTLYDEAGQFDAAHFDQAVASLVQAYVARVGSFDLLVLPYIDVKQVVVKDRNVSWDGVVRRVTVRFRDSAPSNLWLYGRQVPCTSLHVMVYGGDGARRFESWRGLEVVHDFSVYAAKGRVEYRMRDDLFQDHELLRDAIEVALRRLFQGRS